MATGTKEKEDGQRGQLTGTHPLKVLHNVIAAQRNSTGCGYILSFWHF